MNMSKVSNSVKSFFSFFFKRNNEGQNKEFVAKLCCVLFAVVLWLLVAGQNTDVQYEMTYYAVPVTVTNASTISENSGLSIISGYDYNINITVRGNRAKLSNYTSEDIVASVDVGGITEAGDYNLSVLVSVPPSSGFTVVSQSLDSVDVSIDKLTSVDMNVTVNVINAQYDTDSYALGAPTVSPNKVTVKGPQKLLQSISSAAVNLDLGKVSSNIGFNNRILLLDSNKEEVNSPYITLSDQYAEGTVPFISIEEASKIVEKSVPLVCSFKYGHYNNSNSTVSISPQFVTLSGYENELSKIQSLNIATIDETKMTESTVFTSLIEAPDGTTLLEAKKSAVITLTLTEDIARASFPVYEAVFENIPQGRTAELNDMFVLTFRGDQASLSELQKVHDTGEIPFTVEIDLSLLSSPGVYKLPASVMFPSTTFKGVWCEYIEVTVKLS